MGPFSAVLFFPTLLVAGRHSPLRLRALASSCGHVMDLAPALISAALARDKKELFPQDGQLNDLEYRVEMLPSEELEVDCRGNLHVVPKEAAYIGEVITVPAYSKATTQLGIKLSVVAWLVHECFGVPDAESHAMAMCSYFGEEATRCTQGTEMSS